MKSPGKFKKKKLLSPFNSSTSLISTDLDVSLSEKVDII